VGTKSPMSDPFTRRCNLNSFVTAVVVVVAVAVVVVAVVQLKDFFRKKTCRDKTKTKFFF